MRSLTPQMWNVLRILKDATMTRTGRVKRRSLCQSLHLNTVSALERRGLISFKFNTVHGSGYALTSKGWGAIENNE